MTTPIIPPETIADAPREDVTGLRALLERVTPGPLEPVMYANRDSKGIKGGDEKTFARITGNDPERLLADTHLFAMAPSLAADKLRLLDEVARLTRERDQAVLALKAVDLGRQIFNERWHKDQPSQRLEGGVWDQVSAVLSGART